MGVTIRGRAVKVGDSLYNELNHAWGIVKDVDTNTLLIVHTVDGTSVTMRASQEGKINGLVRLDWHEPITVATTSNDVSDVQNIVDTYVKEKNKWLAQ